MKLLKVGIAFIALVSFQIAAAQWLHVPPPVEAKMTPHMAGGGVPVAGTTYPDIVFWLNFEANDTTGTYDLSASECVATGGDTSGTYSGNSTIAGTGCKVGTYCLSGPTSNDYITFSSTTIIPDTKGRIGFWVYFTSWVADHQLFGVAVDATHFWSVSTNSTSHLRINWRSPDGYEHALSGDGSLGTGTWYFIELAYDTTLGATDYADVYVNGTKIINSVAATTPVGAGNFYINDRDSGTNPQPLFDNVMVSTDPTRGFYESGTGLSIAIAKPSGACP